MNKILRWRCDELTQEAGGDPYPEKIRELKQKLVLCLNGMLELRSDTEVHRNILHRCDVQTFRDRVIFVHRYFLGYELKAGAVNLADPTHEDVGLKIPTSSPELVVEPYTNDTLQLLFGEAWELLMLMQQLAAVDEDFRAKIRPRADVAFAVFSPHMFATEGEKRKAEAARVYALKYLQAYNFFPRGFPSMYGGGQSLSNMLY